MTAEEFQEWAWVHQTLHPGAWPAEGTEGAALWWAVWFDRCSEAGLEARDLVRASESLTAVGLGYPSTHLAAILDWCRRDRARSGARGEPDSQDVRTRWPVESRASAGCDECGATGETSRLLWLGAVGVALRGAVYCACPLGLALAGSAELVDGRLQCGSLGRQVELWDRARRGFGALAREGGPWPVALAAGDRWLVPGERVPRGRGGAVVAVASVVEQPVVNWNARWVAAREALLTRGRVSGGYDSRGTSGIARAV